MNRKEAIEHLKNYVYDVNDTVITNSDNLPDSYNTQNPTSALDKQVGGDHYKNLAIQPIDYITKNNLGWHEGNIVKYITRHASKNGKADVEKVIHYAEMLIEFKYGDKNE